MKSFGLGVRKIPEHIRTIAYRGRISVATIGSGKAQGPSKRDPALILISPTWTAQPMFSWSRSGRLTGGAEGPQGIHRCRPESSCDLF